MHRWLPIVAMLAVGCRSEDAPTEGREVRAPKPTTSSKPVANEPDEPAGAASPDPAREAPVTMGLRVVFDPCTPQPRTDAKPAPERRGEATGAPPTLAQVNPLRAYEADVLGCLAGHERVDIPYTVILLYAADGSVVNAQVVSSASEVVDACLVHVALRANRAPGPPGMLRCPVLVMR